MRTRLKLKFNDRKALSDLWERELKRGELFIPSTRCLPVGTLVMLVVTVPDAPAPMELPGQVKLAREPQHCAANQRPGMGIELGLQRRERKAVESYIQGDWAQAALVLGSGEDSTGASRASGLGMAAAPRQAAPAPAPVAAPEGSVVAARRAAPRAAAAQAGPMELASAVLAREGRRPAEVLGLASGASEGEVRRSYLQLVKQLHPDRYFGRLGPEEVEVMERAYQAVSDAYEALQRGVR